MGSERLTICMVTPHLPPDQAANALLPRLLGDRFSEEGHRVTYVSLVSRSGALPSKDVILINPPAPSGSWRRMLRISQARTALEVWWKARKAIMTADVVHVHSNTFMNQVAAAIAALTHRPFVLTHYGTEIWHRKPGRSLLDPFFWMNEHAAHVTYYSRRLLDHSRDVGVVPVSASVVYPPVDARFTPPSREARESARARLGLGKAPFLLNVKRLHPLANQRVLIEAMPRVLERFPEAKLFIAGEGESRSELEALICTLGVAASVRLLGLVDNRELTLYYAAADLFVLPSRLEAFPTVAAEALASGVPVVSADHPGGLELKELFPEDVVLVPRDDVTALAGAIVRALERPTPCSSKTRDRIERELRPKVAAERYLEIYRQAVASQGEPVA